VLLICPASPGSRAGNRTTALRWAAKLRGLGNRVRIRETYWGEACDVLVALHARKSAPAVFASYEARPERPIVVALTGTDLYRDLPDNADAQRAVTLASRLVVLQPLAMNRLDPAHRAKTHVIYQSAEPARGCARPDTAFFDICVSGHLRSEKDPFCAAAAARLLPKRSRIRILHAGGAMTPEFAQRARQEEMENPRYRWLGALRRREARCLAASCRAVALTSRMEGGANVISEAIADDVPVIASHIDGSVGLLGADYPAFFPIGNTEALANLMSRFEEDDSFYQELRRRCLQLRPLFNPEHETAEWRRLLGILFPRGDFDSISA
jgi:putative glycosyltransferase (TIGR04348 family)